MICIYALRCPVANAVRYIGKTKNHATRLDAHISKAKSLQTNHHCAHWIRQLLTQGLSPILEVIRRVNPGDDWQQVEMECIAEYRAAGHPLTNMTAGGDGFHDVHPDVLKKRGKSKSAHLAKPENKAKHIAMANEVGQRPEVRAARSAGVSAAWADTKKRQRMLDGARDPEVLRKRSETSSRTNANPETRAKLSSALKDVWSTPGRRAQAKARVVAMHADPEASARRVAAIKSAYQNPEVLARHAAAMVAARERKAAANSGANT